MMQSGELAKEGREPQEITSESQLNVEENNPYKIEVLQKSKN